MRHTRYKKGVRVVKTPSNTNSRNHQALQGHNRKTGIHNEQKHARSYWISQKSRETVQNRSTFQGMNELTTEVVTNLNHL
jgi:hypothetical protein